MFIQIPRHSTLSCFYLNSMHRITSIFSMSANRISILFPPPSLSLLQAHLSLESSNRIACLSKFHDIQHCHVSILNLRIASLLYRVSTNRIFILFRPPSLSCLHAHLWFFDSHRMSIPIPECSTLSCFYLISFLGDTLLLHASLSRERERE